MAKKNQFCDIYGKISFSRELAKGVRMVVTELSARAVLVTQMIADKFLSAAARTRAVAEDRELAFPEDKMSIPLLELNQKNYIDMYHSQVKEHWNTLVHFLPDYLRDRGILHAKPVPSMLEKMEDETDAYYKSLKTMTKEDLFLHAEDVAAMKTIIAYYADHDLPLSNQGILLNIPELARKTCDYMKQNGMEISTDGIDQLMNSNISDFLSTLDYSDSVNKILAPVKRELFFSREQYVNTVILSYRTEEAEKTITMSVDDFFKYLVTDDVKKAFAEKNMLDFPSEDFYGADKAPLFNELFEKRFGENIVENWNSYAPQSDASRMEISGLSTEIISTSAYDELIARYSIKEYLTTNFKNAQDQINELLDYASRQREILHNFENMLSEYENTAAQETVMDQVTENAEEAKPVESEEAQKVMDELKRIREYRDMKIQFNDRAGIRKIDRMISDMEKRLGELEGTRSADISPTLTDFNTMPPTADMPQPEDIIEEEIVEAI